jgi:hypothetical protein
VVIGVGVGELAIGVGVGVGLVPEFLSVPPVFEYIKNPKVPTIKRNIAPKMAMAFLFIPVCLLSILKSLLL